MAEITYSSVDNEISDFINKSFDDTFRKGYTKANGVMLPVSFKKFGQCILDMEIRDDDVWVCSFPKTGTTWCQEMTWCIGNNVDLEGAKQLLVERFPYLERTPLVDFDTVMQEQPDLNLPMYETDSITLINELKSPRFIKTHLPYKLLPKKLRDHSTKAKILYITRNPKDTCLSYYHYSRLFDGYNGNFDDFCRLFISDSLAFSPYFDHIIGYWEQKNYPKILLLKYEDMKQDLCKQIRRTAQFLGKELTDDQVLVLEDHLSFKSMKNNKAVNFEPILEFYKTDLNYLVDVKGSFIRSGMVGEGKQKMSPGFIKVFDELEEKICLAKIGLKF